jgi:hypothetical protein
VKVQNSPKTADNYVGSDFKVIIHYKKRKGDPAVPLNVLQLRAQYEEKKDHANLTLEMYLADRGYKGEDQVLCLLASELEAVENNGVRTEQNYSLKSHQLVYILSEYLSTMYVAFEVGLDSK